MDLLSRLLYTAWEDDLEHFWMLMPEDKISKSIAQSTINSGPLRNISLLHLTSAKWMVARKHDAEGHNLKIVKELENLIAVLIHQGAYLNTFSTRLSTFLIFQIFGMIETRPHRFRAMKSAVIRWLELLVLGGIDLVEYGHVEIEKLMFDDDKEDPWEINVDLDIFFKNKCTMEILQMTLGEDPEDFDIVFEHLWFSTPLAADFWRWVEEEDDKGDIAKGMPGAWHDE